MLYRTRISVIVLICLMVATITAAKVPSSPKFILKSLDGIVFTPQTLRGKSVYLTFFSKGCKPCEKEVPFLNSLQKKYPDTLKILAVAFMEQDPKRLETLGKQWGMEYPICLDPGEVATRVFEVSTLPKGFLLDHNGNLAASYTGMNEKNEKKLLEEIARLDAELKNMRRKGLSFWVEPSLKVIEGDASLGKKWANRVENILKGLDGVSVVSKKEEADYIIGGKLLDAEGDISIEIIISDKTGAEVTSFTVLVTESDDGQLRTVLKYRIEALRK